MNYVLIIIGYCSAFIQIISSFMQPAIINPFDGQPMMEGLLVTHAIIILLGFMLAGIGHIISAINELKVEEVEDND